MNKSLLALLTVVVLAAGGSAVYFTQKPKLDATRASAASGDLPAGTVVLLAAPDLNGTLADWKTTDLYKIWTEPQVQAFLAKPLSKVPDNKEFNDTWARIAKLDPKNLFVALTALDEKDNHPHVVAGFQFTGDPKEVDALLAKPKELLRDKFPAGKADLTNYQGHAIESFDAGGGNMVASTYVGQRYLVGNDVDLLKKTVDRIEGRAPAGEGTLEKEADFQAVSAKLPGNHATLVFARPQAFLGKLYALAAASGQPVDAEKRAEADKLRAIGATTTIRNGKIRDSVYSLAPSYKKPEATLGMDALPLSSADTLLYIASILNLPEKLDVPAANPAPTPDAADVAATVPGMPNLDFLKGIGKTLEDQGINWETVRKAFGRESSVLLDWPANSAQPSILTSVNVADRAAAGKIVDGLAKTLTSGQGWQTVDAGGVTLHTLTLPNVPFVSPTFALTDKHFILSLSAKGAQDAITREKAGGANFTAGETYRKAADTVPKATQVSGYLDSKTFFERVYGALKPMAVMGIMFYPQANDYVEVGKLPDAETISKHLSPIVLSQSGDDQGILMESEGPATFFQAGAVLAGGLGAALVPVIKQKMGAFGGPQPGADEAPAGTPDDADDGTEAPDITPQSSPASTP